jgi:mono/diheme cytochrome c family protein/rhodanese-related sulfurtransferase
MRRVDFSRDGRAPEALLLLGVLLAGLALGAQRNPPPSNQQVERGREIYGGMCAVCHGPNGEGYRADQAPRIAHPDFLSAVTDQFLHRAIAHGRPGTTMSAWSSERGGPLSKADVDALVALLRSWDHSAATRLDERPITGNAARGAEVYAEECARCHGERGVGGPNIHIGNPQFLTGATNGFLRYAIRKGRSGTTMPGFEDSIGNDRIEDVVALLRTFQQPSGDPSAHLTARPPPVPLGPVPLNPKGPAPIGFNAYPRMTSVDTVKAQLDAGARFAFLDARAPSDYAAEHIAGAVSVPFYDPSPYIAALPRNAWLVCYCACPHAESKELAQKLVAEGFTKVTVLDEGLRVWKAREYPMRAGEKP